MLIFLFVSYSSLEICLNKGGEFVFETIFRKIEKRVLFFDFWRNREKGFGKKIIKKELVIFMILYNWIRTIFIVFA